MNVYFDRPTVWLRIEVRDCPKCIFNCQSVKIKRQNANVHYTNNCMLLVCHYNRLRQTPPSDYFKWFIRKENKSKMTNKIPTRHLWRPIEFQKHVLWLWTYSSFSINFYELKSTFLWHKFFLSVAIFSLPLFCFWFFTLFVKCDIEKNIFDWKSIINVC